MSKLPYIPLAVTVWARPRRVLQNVLIKLYDVFGWEVDDAS